MVVYAKYFPCFGIDHDIYSYHYDAVGFCKQPLCICAVHVERRLCWPDLIPIEFAKVAGLNRLYEPVLRVARSLF